MHFIRDIFNRILFTQFIINISVHDSEFVQASLQDSFPILHPDEKLCICLLHIMKSPSSLRYLLSSLIATDDTFGSGHAKWLGSNLRSESKIPRRWGKLRNIVAALEQEREREREVERRDGREEGKWILSVGWPRLARSGWLNYTFIN